MQTPLGICYLAAALENAGYSVVLADLATVPPGQWKQALPNDCDFYGISATTGEYNTAVATARVIAQLNGDAVCAIGGAHASAVPERCLEDGAFDVVVIGEGERTILEFAECKPWSQIDGICYKTGKGDVVCTAPRKQIKHIDSVAFPARHLLEYSSVVSNDLVSIGTPATCITASRGCLMRCSFCSSRATWGRTYRLRSAENIAAEIEECIETLGIEEVRFVDDQVGVKFSHLKVLCEAIGRFGLKWRTHMRVDHATVERLELLSKSQCIEIAWGCESGAQPILDHNHKGTTVEQNKQAVRLAREFGIQSKVYLIIGLPGETSKTIEQTKRALLEVRPDRTNLSTFVPMPGSDVWNHPKNYDYQIEDTDWGDYWLLGGSEADVPFVGRTSAMSRDDLFRARVEFEQWLYDNGFTKWKDQHRQRQSCEHAKVVANGCN